MQEQQERNEGFSSSNAGYENASALNIRLDTTKILQDIENFLRGREENFYFNEQTQRYESKLVNSGIPKANSKGIQAILNYCRSLINTQVVQGNYTTERYIDLIIEKRIELAERLIVNMYEWDLPTEDTINEVTDFILNIVETFLSRTIDNEERKSYAQTIRTVESNRVENNTKGVNLFK